MADKCMWAVQNGDLELLQSTLVDPNAPINGRLPLVAAADYGQIEVIKFLLSKGANVNSADRHGITPLLAAIWEGHDSAVSVLLKAGADKNGKAPNGCTYLEAAETPEIKQLLQ